VINTTDNPILHSDDALESAVTFLQELADQAMACEAHPGKANPELLADRQARHRLATSIFLRIRKGRPLTTDELNTMHALCIMSDGKKEDAEKAKGLYAELTGEEEPEVTDVRGLRVPLRAMFVRLWVEGKVTLPHSFHVNGVWAKYPDLMKESQSFIYNVSVSQTEYIHRSTRTFQYRVNWHDARDVKFTELWDSAPAVVDKQRSIRKTQGGKTNDFHTWPGFAVSQNSTLIS